MNISIACGGTGGHLFPGLAMAKKFQNRGNTVLLWVDERAVDYARGSGWNGDIETIKASGFNGVSFKSVGVAAKLVHSVVVCWKRMRRDKPDVVLAMGSYASFGPVVAAWLCRIPIVLHEANVIPGRAISFLSRFADLVALSFAESSVYFKGRTELTGFPIREDIIPYFPVDTELKKDIFTILVMGGSQGAHFINELASDALCELVNNGAVIQVIHLAGENDADMVREKYAATGVSSMVFSFLDDMGMAYGMADFALCRSGASTCMELTAFELPALLVPLPTARRGHQAANAKVLADAGAVDMVEQKELSVDWLVGYIGKIVSDNVKREEMKKVLRELAMPDAAVQIAELVERMGGERSTMNVQL